MAAPPAFVPRKLLDVPEYFGVQEDVEWRLARDWREGVLLARAREQHELAYRVHLHQLRHCNSIPDLAVRRPRLGPWQTKSLQRRRRRR